MEIIGMILNHPTINRFFVWVGVGSMNTKDADTLKLEGLGSSSLNYSHDDNFQDEMSSYYAGDPANGFMPGESGMD